MFFFMINILLLFPQNRTSFISTINSPHEIIKLLLVSQGSDEMTNSDQMSLETQSAAEFKRIPSELKLSMILQST